MEKMFQSISVNLLTTDVCPLCIWLLCRHLNWKTSAVKKKRVRQTFAYAFGSQMPLHREQDGGFSQLGAEGWLA